MYHAKSERKKFGVALLLLHKVAFTKSITKVKFIMIKESIKQKDVKIINTCAFNKAKTDRTKERLKVNMKRRD